MFTMTKSRVLDGLQSEDGDINKRHYGEDLQFYLKMYQVMQFDNIHTIRLH